MTPVPGEANILCGPQRVLHAWAEQTHTSQTPTHITFKSLKKNKKKKKKKKKNLPAKPHKGKEDHEVCVNLSNEKNKRHPAYEDAKD